jgi:hypothetical protein
MSIKLKSLGLLGILTAITTSINISPALADTTLRVDRKYKSNARTKTT